MVRVTVNLPEAAAAVPEIKQRMLDAGCDGAAHRRLPLQRPPAADEVSRPAPPRSTSTASIPGNVGTGTPPRRAVRHDLQGGRRSRQAGTDRRQRRLAQPGAGRRAKMQENTDRDLGKSSEEIINDCMVHLGARVDRARARKRTAQGSDHHLVQDVAAARSDRRLSHARAPDRSAAAPRPHRSRDGREGARLVGVGDGRAARRGHRRHDSRVVDAAARRRSPRRGLRGVRAAAGARPARRSRRA